MLITLDPDAVAALEVCLGQFPKKTRQKGEAVVAEHRVVELSPAKAGEPRFTAAVRDERRHEVSLWYEKGGWKMACTCPAAANGCKHQYAALRTLLDVANRKRPAPATAAQPKPARGAPSFPKPTQPVPKAAAPKPAPASGTFTALVEEKLGGALSEKEQAIAQEVQRIFDTHKSTSQIYERDISALLGKGVAWSWETFQPWPAPPKDVWTAWLYVAHFLRRKRVPLPGFLVSITPTTEIDALVAPWLREKEIEKWTKVLQGTLRAAEKDSTPEIDLRAIFDSEGAYLESREGEEEWSRLKPTRHDAMVRGWVNNNLRLSPEACSVWAAFRAGPAYNNVMNYGDSQCERALNQLLRNPLLVSRVLTEKREPFRREETPLKWQLDPAASELEDYRFSLVCQDGARPPASLAILSGKPLLYVTAEAVFTAPPLGLPTERGRSPAIPAPALETAAGVTLLQAASIPLPPRLEGRVEQRKARLIVECKVEPALARIGEEELRMRILADWGGAAPDEIFSESGWNVSLVGRPSRQGREISEVGDRIFSLNRAPLAAAENIAADLRASWSFHSNTWERRMGKKFAEEFSEWLESLPPETELRLDPILATLEDQPIRATVRLDVEPAGVDWFDVQVELDLPEVELTPEEIAALLAAKGTWIRFGEKGWRRLALNLSEEDDRNLAELGMSPRDLASGEPQRLHALQLAHQGANHLLPPERVVELRQRAEDLQARVTPPVPPEIGAELRPYQVEGFHFLAYLTANRFGGLLADDMGLGKTLQTLTWLVWARQQPEYKGAPTLVLCPKSVMDNWQSEAKRFASHLRVHLWRRAEERPFVDVLRECDVMVLNYSQLRLLLDDLTRVSWHTVILDEAQAVKNPDSQTARAACSLNAEYRLALTGTPIENRLLDLWSIMTFAMPGILGPRARFARTYDQREDPLARRRLAARMRPFLLRRTKEQVARDLPDRIEEDLICEMEGKQATLYRAELKRARQALLKVKSAKELDGARFHILTSLLRLRQICCHPALVDAAAKDESSAKLEALLELIEPLIEEGRKVLVFSQFVGVIELLQRAIEARKWPTFVLTGQTEDRGDLIESFQQSEGGAVFLLSLKASGFGLNLTAASYVVLYDPWWNPAVENQAIDRTHRIGQTSTVFAYRLIVKGSIEEKIRHLQKQKRALADDILGEEAFAQALTLDDLRMLLSDE